MMLKTSQWHGPRRKQVLAKHRSEGSKKSEATNKTSFCLGGFKVSTCFFSYIILYIYAYFKCFCCLMLFHVFWFLLGVCFRHSTNVRKCWVWLQHVRLIQIYDLNWYSMFWMWIPFGDQGSRKKNNKHLGLWLLGDARLQKNAKVMMCLW